MIGSADPEGRDRSATGPDDLKTADREALIEEIGSLELQNRKLRERYERNRRENHRGTARAMAAVGLVALVVAAVFPELREVLIALGSTGMFAAALTYYLTPGRFVPATTGEQVYDAYATNTAALVRQLGLSGPRVYVPTEGSPQARLFVPQYEEYDLPTASALRSPLVASETERERGVAITPVGALLFEEFERSLSEPLASSPKGLATQLCDGPSGTFEFARTVDVTATTDADSGQASFGVVDPAWEPVDRVDHPVSSFLATGFAVGFGSPVEVTVVADHDEGEYDTLVTVKWEGPD
jgi:hypothetical protein